MQIIIVVKNESQKKAAEGIGIFTAKVLSLQCKTIGQRIQLRMSKPLCLSRQCFSAALVLIRRPWRAFGH